MKKSLLFRIASYALCVLFIISVVCSCNKKGESFTDSIFGTTTENIESTIDFNLVDRINESNKKVIDITTIVAEHINDNTKRQLVLKIKNDHQIIDLELKQFAKNNLILIPKPIYILNNNPDSFKGPNVDVYLLHWLKKEINNQITQFDSIETTTKNSDFKTFATKSKEILEQNNDALQSSLSI